MLGKYMCTDRLRPKALSPTILSQWASDNAMCQGRPAKTAWGSDMGEVYWQSGDLLTGSCHYDHVFHEHLLGTSCVLGSGVTKTNTALGRCSVWLGGQTGKQLNNRIGMITEALMRNLKNSTEEV